jgi:tetratricopeptide (TPR) repeat protein
MRRAAWFLILLAGPVQPQEILSHSVAEIRETPAEDLSIVLRVMNMAPVFLGQAEVRTEADPIPGDRSQVLVLFRLSERGWVLDARAVSGSAPAQRSALNAIKMWRYKPTLLNGRPVEMMAGVVFDFSTTPVHVEAPKPMTADQVSPVLSARCPLAIERRDPDAVLICKKECATVDGNPSHTAMESLTAHDELGLAHLKLGEDAAAAVTEFSRAIELAPEGLGPTDAEWAKLYWHRGRAERQAGQSGEANRDFEIAEKSLGDAAEATPDASNVYKDLLRELARQHASLLE